MIRQTTRPALWAFFSMLLLVAACDEPPGPGTYAVVVEAAVPDVDGALLRIEGQGLTRVEPRSITLVRADSGDAPLYVIVRGAMAVGDTLMLAYVSNVSARPDVAILQVSATSAAGYAALPVSAVRFGMRRVER